MFIQMFDRGIDSAVNGLHLAAEHLVPTPIPILIHLCGVNPFDLLNHSVLDETQFGRPEIL